MFVPGTLRQYTNTCVRVCVCVYSCVQSRDTAGYDEYVEGVEPDETASLETFIGEVGVA